jgi:hypothetical protein
VDYQTIDKELFALGITLENADDATVHAHMERLRALAAQIDDETDRLRALRRIDRLPRLARPAPLGESPQYAEALRIVAQSHEFQGTAAERLAQADQTATRVAELARQAPPLEGAAIMRMNTSLKRRIDALRHELT